MQRRLEVVCVDDYESVLDNVLFKDVYYGDADIQQVVIFNNSPITSNYLISLDAKKSCSITVSGSLALSIKGNVHVKACDFQNQFQISPSQVNITDGRHSLIFYVVCW